MKETFFKIKNKYETLTNIEEIKSQMVDLEKPDTLIDTSAKDNKSYYNEKIQQFYELVTMKHFDIFDSLSNFWNYLYTQYLLPIYYKNFYINMKKE
jgi:hypothetical protein